MTLVSRVLDRLADIIGSEPRYESFRVFGRDLSLRRGTLRQPSDYDDAWFVACARHASTLFDVGANVGNDAILALAVGDIKRIVLVEANPLALAVAAENLIRNGMSAQANFIPAFASDIAGARTMFWTTGTGAAGSMYSAHAVTAAARGARFAVPTTTLDALCDQYGLRPDLVKIDVEGAESKVLAGSVLLAGSRQTRYLVELHSNPELSMLENGKRVLDWCGSVGFEAWYLKEHCALRSPQLIADRGRCHVLLQPSGWPYPDWLRGISQSAAVPDVFASH